MSDIVDLIDRILNEMEGAELMNKLTGEDKKRFVIDFINQYLDREYGPEHSKPYKVMVPHIIEIIINLTKGKYQINRKVKKCRSCFGI